tara:strand:- start:566 stop:1546 length:981 start_codon:yes stop_codon:yes gene_type:complete
VKKLQVKKLGVTDIKCPVIGFGGAPIGNLFRRISNIESFEILKESQLNSINFYDTSPFYGYGLSEKRIGEFIKTLDRDKFIISTKVGRYLIPESSSKINRGVFKGGLNFKPVIDYSYDGVMKSFEQSMKRLNLDKIDLCLIHDVDYFTHGSNFEYYFKESLKGAYIALQKLKEEKLIKAIGLGLNDADIANRFLLCESFDCVLLAGRYTLLDKSAEKEFFQTAQEKRVGIILAGIFNSGILAKGIKKSTYFYKSIPSVIKNKYIRISNLCKKFNISVKSAAIQFPLRQESVNSLLLGIDEKKQIKENIALLNVKIDEDFWLELKKI